MIDIQLVRRDPDRVRAALARRGDTSDLDRLVVSDTRWREQTGRRDEVRARVKSLSRDVAEARRAQDAARAEELAGQSRSLGQEEKALEWDQAHATVVALVEPLMPSVLAAMFPAPTTGF